MIIAFWQLGWVTHDWNCCTISCPHYFPGTQWKSDWCSTNHFIKYHLGHTCALHELLMSYTVQISCTIYSTVGEISLGCIAQALYLCVLCFSKGQRCNYGGWRKGSNVHQGIGSCHCKLGLQKYWNLIKRNSKPCHPRQHHIQQHLISQAVHIGSHSEARIK